MYNNLVKGKCLRKLRILRSVDGLVLLQLHHDVVRVDELVAHGAVPERLVREHLVEPLVVLHELGEGGLKATRLAWQLGQAIVRSTCKEELEGARARRDQSKRSSSAEDSRRLQ